MTTAGFINVILKKRLLLGSHNERKKAPNGAFFVFYAVISLNILAKLVTKLLWRLVNQLSMIVSYSSKIPCDNTATPLFSSNQKFKQLA